MEIGYNELGQNTTNIEKVTYKENAKKDNETLALMFYALEDHIFP